MRHGVERNPAMSAGAATKYIRARSNADSRREFDLGKFHWAIVRVSYGQQVDESWIHYTVRLQKQDCLLR